MKPYLIDVPVALIFFNRPEVFSKVFQRISELRPSILFLIQDGPRKNKESDLEKIQQCRDIVSNIGWECTVHKDYSEENIGCGRRIFSGLKNAFKIVDRLVIIEDDIVISDTFLPFCAELLERYKDDQRINLISGMNHFGVYEDCPYSYFFSRGGAIWGWATWRRVCENVSWDLHESEIDYVNKTLVRNKYPRDYGKYLSGRSKELHDLIKSGGAPSFWSFHYLYYTYMQSRINIVPKYNMISNIGLTEDSTHATNSLRKLPHHTQKLFFTKRYNIEMPLIHPPFILEDRYYKIIQDNLMYPKGIMKYLAMIETKLRVMFLK